MVTKEQLEELESKHKRIAYVRSDSDDGSGTPDWEIVLRKPTRDEYKQFRAQSNDASRASDAQEMLIRRLSVLPTGDALNDLFNEWPAIAEACTAPLRALSGLAGQEAKK